MTGTPAASVLSPVTTSSELRMPKYVESTPKVRRKYAESTPRRQVAHRSWQTVADHGRKNSTLSEHLLTSAAGTPASYNPRSPRIHTSIHLPLPPPPRPVSP